MRAKKSLIRTAPGSKMVGPEGGAAVCLGSSDWVGQLRNRAGAAYGDRGDPTDRQEVAMSTIFNPKSGFLCSVVLALALLVASCTGAEGTDVESQPMDVAGEYVAPPVDPDGDGYPTTVEISYGTDPYNAASQPPDVDGD
jgi:hypothetical protein